MSFCKVLRAGLIILSINHNYCGDKKPPALTNAGGEKKEVQGIKGIISCENSNPKRKTWTIKSNHSKNKGGCQLLAIILRIDKSKHGVKNFGEFRQAFVESILENTIIIHRSTLDDALKYTQDLGYAEDDSKNPFTLLSISPDSCEATVGIILLDSNGNILDYIPIFVKAEDIMTSESLKHIIGASGYLTQRRQLRNAQKGKPVSSENQNYQTGAIRFKITQEAGVCVFANCVGYYYDNQGVILCNYYDNYFGAKESERLAFLFTATGTEIFIPTVPPKPNTRTTATIEVSSVKITDTYGRESKSIECQMKTIQARLNSLI